MEIRLLILLAIIPGFPFAGNFNNPGKVAQAPEIKKMIITKVYQARKGG
jgi:hypothetical protein